MWECDNSSQWCSKCQKKVCFTDTGSDEVSQKASKLILVRFRGWFRGWFKVCFLLCSVQVCICGKLRKTSVFDYGFWRHENRKYCITFALELKDCYVDGNIDVCVYKAFEHAKLVWRSLAWVIIPDSSWSVSKAVWVKDCEKKPPFRGRCFPVQSIEL